MEQRVGCGLSQVLADGSNTYLYGNTRIAQEDEETTGYFLDDALGSVRQVTNGETEIVLEKEYSPFGSTLSSSGDFDTDYGYTPKKNGAGR